MNKLKEIIKYFLGIYCAVTRRHSRFITSFWGYQYCGRCGEQIGDTLGSIGIAWVIGIDKYHKRNCKSCNKVRRSWKGVAKVTKPIEERFLKWVNN